MSIKQHTNQTAACLWFALRSGPPELRAFTLKRLPNVERLTKVHHTKPHHTQDAYASTIINHKPQSQTQTHFTTTEIKLATDTNFDRLIFVCFVYVLRFNVDFLCVPL